MLISTEYYTNEGGVKMVRENYGPDEGHITSTVEYAAYSGNVEDMPAPVLEATQLDRIEAQTAYIAMMIDGGDI